MSVPYLLQSTELQQDKDSRLYHMRLGLLSFLHSGRRYPYPCIIFLRKSFTLSHSAKLYQSSATMAALLVMSFCWISTSFPTYDFKSSQQWWYIHPQPFPWSHPYKLWVIGFFWEYSWFVWTILITCLCSSVAVSPLSFGLCLHLLFFLIWKSFKRGDRELAKAERISEVLSI